MGHTDDGIMLTDREREVLAELAGSIGDPWLARQLVGPDPLPSGRPSRPRRRRPSWLRLPHVKVLSGWAGVVLVLLGAAVALATFAWSTPLAVAGLAVMGLGLWSVAADGDGVVARWVASRRDRPRPASPVSPPPPPRTPPGGP